MGNEPIKVAIVREMDKSTKPNENVICSKDNGNLMIELNDGVQFDLSKIANRMKPQDIKLILHYEYKESSNGKVSFQRRNKIILVNCSLKEYKERPISITVKVAAQKYLEIGTFFVVNETELEPKEENIFKPIDKFRVDTYIAKSDVWKKVNKQDEGYQKLVEYYNSYKRESQQSITNAYYQNGLLEVYYGSIYESLINFKTERIVAKASAMCSYIAIKRYMDKFFQENKLNYRVSNPNVFVKNTNFECDALIIDSRKVKDCENKYFFDKDEVVAVIEIKTGGYFTSSESPLGKFSDYIKERIIEGKKYIYFSISETYSVKDESKHYYEHLLSQIAEINNVIDDRNETVYGIFCGIIRNSQTMYIPYEYDLDKMLLKIFKNNSTLEMI